MMLLEEPDGTFTVIGVCVFCDRFSELYGVDKDAYIRWRSGAYIDDAFPGMTAGERETLITGAHKDCWEETFGSNEDEILMGRSFSERLTQ